MVVLRPGYCDFGIAPSPADLQAAFAFRMQYLQLLLFVSTSVLGVRTLTAALFWSHHKRMEVEPLRLMVLLDLLYSNEMSQHCLGLWIPYSWYMSQHIQIVFRMVSSFVWVVCTLLLVYESAYPDGLQNGSNFVFKHSPHCGYLFYLIPWSWGFGYVLFVMSQHDMRPLRTDAPVVPLCAMFRCLLDAFIWRH